MQLLLQGLKNSISGQPQSSDGGRVANVPKTKKPSKRSSGENSVIRFRRNALSVAGDKIMRDVSGAIERLRTVGDNNYPQQSPILTIADWQTLAEEYLAERGGPISSEHSLSPFASGF